MTQLQQLSKLLNDAMKAEADYINSKSTPSLEEGEGISIINITIDMVPELKRLATIRKDAQKALEEYIQNNTLETI